MSFANHLWTATEWFHQQHVIGSQLVTYMSISLISMTITLVVLGFILKELNAYKPIKMTPMNNTIAPYPINCQTKDMSSVNSVSQTKETQQSYPQKGEKLCL